MGGDRRARDRVDVDARLHRMPRRLAAQLIEEAPRADLVAARLAVDEDLGTTDRTVSAELDGKGDGLGLPELVVDEGIAIHASAGGRHIKHVIVARGTVAESFREALAQPWPNGKSLEPDRVRLGEELGEERARGVIHRVRA